MNTSYYTGANLIIRRNNYFYPRTIYEGHPLIIQKNCNCSAGNNNGGNGTKKKKTYKQICPLPANNGNGNGSSFGKDDVEGLLEKNEEGLEFNKYKEPISPPKKISEEFKDFYFYEKHWRPSSENSGGVGGGCGTGSGLGGSGGNGGIGALDRGTGIQGHQCDTSNWADKMSVEANIVEANGHRDLEIRLCYVK